MLEKLVIRYASLTPDDINQISVNESIIWDKKEHRVSSEVILGIAAQFELESLQEENSSFILNYIEDNLKDYDYIFANVSVYLSPDTDKLLSSLAKRCDCKWQQLLDAAVVSRINKWRDLGPEFFIENFIASGYLEKKAAADLAIKQKKQTAENKNSPWKLVISMIAGREMAVISTTRKSDGSGDSNQYGAEQKWFVLLDKLIKYNKPLPESIELVVNSIEYEWEMHKFDAGWYESGKGDMCKVTCRTAFLSNNQASVLIAEIPGIRQQYKDGIDQDVLLVAANSKLALDKILELFDLK